MSFEERDLRTGPVYGDGSTKTFAYSFLIYDESEIELVVTDEDGEETIYTYNDGDFTVSGVDNPSGGSVTLDAAIDAPLATDQVLARPATELQQTLALSEGGGVPMVNLMKAIDKTNFRICELKEQIERCVRGGAVVILNEITNPIDGRVLKMQEEVDGSFTIVSSTYDPDTGFQAAIDEVDAAVASAQAILDTIQAGAYIQETDTDTTDFDFVVDEDDMSSDLATKVPTQQSVKAYADALSALAVKLTGNQTVAGVKTFSSSPIVPTPSTDYQASTKKYVDDEIAGIDTTPPSASVSQAKLKTTTGEVSRSSGGGHHILPGGEYGFYPQFKGQDSSSEMYARLFDYSGGGYPSTSYTTYIYLQASSTSGDTIYAKQRYVTSSGIDNWIFILTDKEDKVISTWKAPDHPCYGNGEDWEELPHPFLDYDADNQNIYCIEKENAKSLLSVSLSDINESYELSAEEYDYAPIHSGWFDESEQPVYVPSLPDYIKIKKLVSK